MTPATLKNGMKHGSINTKKDSNLSALPNFHTLPDVSFLRPLPAQMSSKLRPRWLRGHGPRKSDHHSFLSFFQPRRLTNNGGGSATFFKCHSPSSAVRSSGPSPISANFSFRVHVVGNLLSLGPKNGHKINTPPKHPLHLQSQRKPQLPTGEVSFCSRLEWRMRLLHGHWKFQEDQSWAEGRLWGGGRGLPEKMPFPITFWQFLRGGPGLKVKLHLSFAEFLCILYAVFAKGLRMSHSRLFWHANLLWAQCKYSFYVGMHLHI